MVAPIRGASSVQQLIGSINPKDNAAKLTGKVLEASSKNIGTLNNIQAINSRGEEDRGSVLSAIQAGVDLFNSPTGTATAEPGIGALVNKIG